MSDTSEVPFCGSCRTEKVVGTLYDCKSVETKFCKFKHHFGNGYFCTHPNRNEFVMTLKANVHWNYFIHFWWWDYSRLLESDVGHEQNKVINSGSGLMPEQNIKKILKKLASNWLMIFYWIKMMRWHMMKYQGLTNRSPDLT